MTNTLRVLHVDDEPDFAEMAGTFLEREDARFEVETTTGANEGLDRLADGDFDCVVSDYDMPGQDGIEFLEAVREEYPDLPFILYTGKGSEEVASDAISAGVTDYIQKDSGTSQYTVLANRIQNVVEQYRSRRAVEETEQKLSQLAEKTDDILFMFDSDWTELLFINSAYEDIWDRSITELKENPRSFLENVHPDDQTVVEETLERILAGKPTEVEHRVYTDEGDVRWIYSEAKPVFDEEGTFTRIVGFVRDITDRKERERAIKELNNTTQEIIEAETVEEVAEIIVETVRDILDMPANGVHLYDEADGGLVPMAWTERTEEIVGEPPTFAPGEGIAGRAFETGEPRIYDDVSTVADRYNPDTDVRSQIILPLGDHGVLLIGSPAPDAFDDVDVSLADTLAAHATTALDRVEQEQTLREERDFITQALNTLPDVFYLIDADGGLRRWNERVPEVTGYTDEEIADMQAVEFFHEDEQERIVESIEATLETGWTTVEADLRTADGDRIPYEFAGGRVTDPAGDLVGLVGIGREISERKEREEELARRQSLFEAVLEASIDGLLVIDENREYVTWNQQFIDMWGIPEELIGDNPEELALEWALDQVENPNKFIEKVEYLYEHPHEKSRDQIRLTDGRVFDRYSAPVEADDGSYVGRVWFFRDITERERREHELTRQNERLEEFASVVSHDLRNPLNVAEGRLELAREECDSDHLDDAADAVDRSLTLIDDLLTLAREGEQVSEFEAVGLSETVEGCWQHVETNDAVLVTETDRTIQADGSRLEQLLENLIRNAVEHGGDDVTITIGDLDDGFYVADDGPGIPSDEREKVFETGYSTAAEGIGFGLNIAQDIADAHGWTITVTESQDGGARFEITGIEFTNC